MVKSMKKKIKIGWGIAAIVVAVPAMILLLGNLYLDHLLQKLDHQEAITIEEAEIAPEVILANQDRHVVNIALFGADNDEQNPTSESEDRSDAMKIISLDYDNKIVKITSVERDLVVWIPGDYQKFGHFNWAYWIGGPTLAVQTLNYNLDLDITQYITFSFSALEKLVDLVGGVDIDLTSAEIRQQNKPLGIQGPAGTYTLDGYHAMMYCRIRYIDSDFSRMERQNNVIQAIVSKLKDRSVFELMDIVNEMLPLVTTNLSSNEIKEMLVALLSFDLSNIETYKEPSGEYDDIATCPGLGGYLVRSYSEMVIHLHRNIYGIEDYQPSQTILENEKKTYEKYGDFPNK